MCLVFLGSVCQGTGLLPTAANSVAVMANLIYGPLFGLFLASGPSSPLGLVRVGASALFSLCLAPHAHSICSPFPLSFGLFSSTHAAGQLYDMFLYVLWHRTASSFSLKSAGSSALNHDGRSYSYMYTSTDSVL